MQVRILPSVAPRNKQALNETSFSWAVYLSSYFFNLTKETIMSTSTRKRYGLSNFILDLLLIFLTGGLWLIWIFVREMRNR